MKKEENVNNKSVCAQRTLIVCTVQYSTWWLLLFHMAVVADYFKQQKSTEGPNCIDYECSTHTAHSQVEKEEEEEEAALYI